MTTTPAVGTLFTVPRKTYGGKIELREYRVTTVRQGKIYYVDTRFGSEHRNRPVNMGLRSDAVIVSVPDKTKAVSTPSPRLGKREMAALYRKAHEAGLAAGKAHTPRAMVVAQHAHPLDDSSPVVQAWYEPAGVCGMAWVHLPATSAFAKWLVSTGKAYRSDYYGGIIVSCQEFNQSMERKQAYVAAFAQVLIDAGFPKVRTGSRMD
jgi:hypothetical protein